MTIGWHFDNSYSKLSKTFKEDIKPTPVHEPELVILNDELAKNLNLNFSGIDKKKLAEIFSGNSLPDGTNSIAEHMLVINLVISRCLEMVELFY